MLTLETELINDEEDGQGPTKLYVVPYELLRADELVIMESDYEINDWIEIAGKRVLFRSVPKYIRNIIELKIEKAHRPPISR